MQISVGSLSAPSAPNKSQRPQSGGLLTRPHLQPRCTAVPNELSLRGHSFRHGLPDPPGSHRWVRGGRRKKRASKDVAQTRKNKLAKSNITQVTI